MAYSNHYLTNVILRADFVVPIDDWKQYIPQSVRASAVANYPIVEPRTITNQSVFLESAVQESRTAVNKDQTIEWNFFGRHREKKLIVAHNCVLIDHSSYVSFQELKREFTSVLREVFALRKDLLIGRLGLRYINQVQPAHSDMPGDPNLYRLWETYIDSRLISSLSFPVEQARLSRSMGTIEMNYEEYMLRLQYGIHNEDYPAPIKHKPFIVDIDAYATGAFLETELEELLNTLHSASGTWFENSITNALREKMGGSKQ